MSRILDQEIENLASVFKAFGDPLRLRAYARLQKGECSAGDLAAALKAAPNRLSPHLRMLVSTGFISVRPVGRQRLYSIRDRTVCDLLAQGRQTALQVLLRSSRRAA